MLRTPFRVMVVVLILAVPHCSTVAEASEGFVYRGPRGDGYWLAGGDGGVFSFGDAPFLGRPEADERYVAVEHQPPCQDAGYYTVTGSGRVSAFGAARPGYGDASAIDLAEPIVGMAVDRGGSGYYLAARDGGVFTFPDHLRFHGSVAGKPHAPIVAIASVWNGYLVASSIGEVFAFGGAEHFGDLRGMRLNAPVVGIEASHTGQGYWLAAADGGVFAFGDAEFLGSAASEPRDRPIVAIASSRTSTKWTPENPKTSHPGYALVADDGQLFSFGSWPQHGSTTELNLAAPIVGITISGYQSCA